MRKVSILISFWFVSLGVFSQTILENNAPEIKWSQINTPHFQVLFPTGDDTQAQRVANTLEAMHSPEAASLGSEPKKIPILLQSQSSVSNAFVSVAPRRSEFYMMPSQNYNFMGNTDWLDLISSHEYRHVVQFEHAKVGFNKFVYTLFGNNTFSAMAHAAAPDWFWEGDAVAIETAYTPTGRGKIPNFGLVFKSNLLEGRTFNYHKQYLRSYKNFIPNHYVLGFHMVSYLRRKTNDPEIWGKITRRAWGLSFVPFTFSNAIKKETGLHVTDLYNEMASELRKEWQTEIDQLQITEFERVNMRSKKAYTDYEFPQPLEDGGVLVLKSGIGDIQQLVVLKSGKEKKVFTPGIMNESGMLSVTNSMVVWNEFGYHPRWRVKNYSLIKAFDLVNKKKRVMPIPGGYDPNNRGIPLSFNTSTDSVHTIPGKKSRYAGAALSPDGQQVVTVRTDTEYHSNVLVLDFITGKILHEYPNPANEFYSMARFSEDGKKIVALKANRKQKAVVLIDVESGSEELILPYTDENIGHPVLVGEYMLYNSPFSGIDNIYAVSLASKEKFQITSSKYGAYNPAVNKDHSLLYYNDQTKDGLDVVKIPFDPTFWKSIGKPYSGPNLYQHLLDQEEGSKTLLTNIPEVKYPVARYSKLKGVINPYSWGMFVNDDLTSASIGINSRDILSTTAIDLGYHFDINERTGYWQAGLSYQGWFPIVDLAYRYGNRSVDEGTFDILVINGIDSTNVEQDITFQWNEHNVEAGLRIPLLTTHSKYNSTLSFGNYIGYTKAYDFQNELTTGRFVPAIIRDDTIRNVYPYFGYVGNNELVYNHFTLSASRFLKTSTRDILPRWGQAVSMQYYQTFTGSDLNGGLFSFWGRLYFPGLFRHHSINGHWAYQKYLVDRTFNDYLFRNSIPLVRGQGVSRFGEFYSMAINYALPIWYPDIAMGPILNIQRLRANFFFDYGFGSNSLYGGATRTYTSLGTEIKFDINIFRFLPQLDVGFRYSIGLQPSTTRFEFLLGTFNF